MGDGSFAKDVTIARDDVTRAFPGAEYARSGELETSPPDFA